MIFYNCNSCSLISGVCKMAAPPPPPGLSVLSLPLPPGCPLPCMQYPEAPWPPDIQGKDSGCRMWSGQPVCRQRTHFHAPG